HTCEYMHTLTSPKNHRAPPALTLLPTPLPPFKNATARYYSALAGDSPMSSAASNITSVLKETRVFPPPPAFAANAFVKSQAEYELLWTRAKDDPEGFWCEQAESLHWF